jgi:hypothetical protein
MASLNIYIPDDLKEQMGHIKNVSWSNVAQIAFRESINQQRKKNMNIQSAIERVRATKPDPRELGRLDGLRVALELFTYNDFIAIEKLDRNGDHLVSREWSSLDYIEWISDHVKHPKEKMFDPTRFDSYLYVCGWIEGVLEAWRDIAPNIN